MQVLLVLLDLNLMNILYLVIEISHTMNINKIHFVSQENDKLFLYGKKLTSCGKKHNEVADYTSLKEYVTCQKCKSQILK
jgi:hypothetical protein